ncbi:hypothetical protein ACSBPU_12835 [Parapusillimonas sp. JC17]|uniref:hypothetical protein n=1 Tax=Parapusillimonas sp. JC17 TaxID=3445768 RepID=UPI003F9ECDE9
MPSNEDLNATIRSLSSHRSTLEIELDGHLEKLLLELAAQIKAWMEKEVERQIAANAKQFSEMSDESVHQFKSTLDALYSKLPQHVTRAGQHTKTPPHRSKNAGTADTLTRDYLREIFDLVASELGRPLFNANLFSPTMAPGASWRRSCDGRTYELSSWVSPECPTCDVYVATLREYIGVCIDLSKAQAQLQQENALSRWKSI